MFSPKSLIHDHSFTNNNNNGTINAHYAGIMNDHHPRQPPPSYTSSILNNAHYSVSYPSAYPTDPHHGVDIVKSSSYRIHNHHHSDHHHHHRTHHVSPLTPIDTSSGYYSDWLPPSPTNLYTPPLASSIRHRSQSILNGSNNSNNVGMGDLVDHHSYQHHSPSDNHHHLEGINYNTDVDSCVSQGALLLSGLNNNHNHHNHHQHPSPLALVHDAAGGNMVGNGMIKKKRKRADARQLAILNETYAKTAFPSTEERKSLAQRLDMTPRSVQIWFQNRRQNDRLIRRAVSVVSPATSPTTASTSFSQSSSNGKQQHHPSVSSSPRANGIHTLLQQQETSSSSASYTASVDKLSSGILGNTRSLKVRG